jgi:hypothetical protein
MCEIRLISYSQCLFQQCREDGIRSCRLIATDYVLADLLNFFSCLKVGIERTTSILKFRYARNLDVQILSHYVSMYECCRVKPKNELRKRIFKFVA